ncbi:DUF6783 domain-containing protein [Anaerobutyricum hallii]|uniref:DUF6783 domain-containing protein n=1 Tax=Anaerobutyricum hallii TaxID=39488 RepID=UPI003FA4950C
MNVRLTTCIQPLLRGHKYRVSALFGRFPGFIHSPYNSFAFFSIFIANWGVQIVGTFFQTRSS